jgi:hypothetical protein
MEALVVFLTSSTARRFLAFIVGIACTALNKKLGLEISENAQMEITGLVMGYIGQSAWKDTRTAQAIAASTIPAAPVVADLSAALAVANAK